MLIRRLYSIFIQARQAPLRYMRFDRHFGRLQVDRWRAAAGARHFHPRGRGIVFLIRHARFPRRIGLPGILRAQHGRNVSNRYSNKLYQRTFVRPLRDPHGLGPGLQQRPRHLAGQAIMEGP